MPYSPKPRCRVCKQLHCADPEHKRKPHGWGHGTTPTNARRPQFATAAERTRRRQAVDAWLIEHGHSGPHGLAAICPDCGMWRASWVADHVVSIADGGTEDGRLRVHCRSCSNKQGSMLGSKRQRGRA